MENIKKSILGFVVGDALGVPVEFKSRDELSKNPLNEMVGYGSHKVPKGTWSDDTSMMLATMDSIIKNNNIDYFDIMQKFYYWFYGNQYTSTGEVFDIGIATRKALHNYTCGVDPLLCGGRGFYDNGNGSLMRILPIALYFVNNTLNFQEEKNIVDNVSSLTHSHEISRLACKIYCDYVKNLFAGHDKVMALKILPKDDYMKNYKKETIDLFYNILSNNIINFDEKHIKSSGFVVDTLEACLWSNLTANTLKDAILKSINLGDDTDTIGALTGALSAIIFCDDIPLEWIQQLQNKDYLLNLIDKFEKTLNNEKINNNFKL